MTLEQWQKLADIVLKGVVAAGLAIGTYLVTRDQTSMNKSKLCGELLQANFDYVQNNAFTDARQTLLAAKLDVQGRICGPADDKLVTMLNNNWRSPATPAEAMGDAGETARVAVADRSPAGGAVEPPAGAMSVAAPDTRPLEVEANLDRPQWVAVSRRNDKSYSAENFDLVTGKPPLGAPGNVLRARWFVNIRAKNTPVVNGDNPVIGQLLAGQCVRIDAAATGALNEWGQVRRVACPSEARR